jgi:ornithine cyclodeaminase
MSARPALQVFEEAAIRDAVTDAVALKAAQRAFLALGRGEALVPPALGVDLEDVGGEVHVKGAYLHGSPVFAFKVATGFYGNTARGLPSGSGLVLVFDASTGFPLGLLADNGYLTDLRTAAAGALAASWLAPARPLVVAVLGAGIQARLQLRLISRVRSITEIRVWSPHPASREACAAELVETLKIPAAARPTPMAAVADADLVVTVTPSRQPLVTANMLRPGVTVIAVGSDGPDKRELASDVLGRAGKIVTDRTEQCLRLGELHHAVEAGVLSAERVHAELGEIQAGLRPGREGDESIACDLTGVGAQDAAIAEAAWNLLTRPGQR